MWKLDEAAYRKGELGPACDAFAKTGEIPDVFVLYALPLEIADEREIRAAYDGMGLFWNRIKQESKYAKLLSVLLSAKVRADHRDMLLDAKTRAAARAAAEAERKARAEARFAALDASIAIVAAKGHVTPAEMTSLVARGRKDGLSEAEVRVRVRVPEQESAAELPRDEGLPAGTRAEIRSNLRVFKMSSLYEFLGLASDRAPTRAEIRSAYEAKESEWRPKPKDHLKTAADLLIGFIKTCLVDGDPARYEAARRWELVESLQPEVELAGSDKRIDHREFDALRQRAVDLGLGEKDATDILLALAQKIGAAVEFSSADEGHTCGNCRAVVRDAKGREKCPFCSAPLWKKCPRCATNGPSAAPACGSCSMTFADLPRVTLLVELGRHALGEGRIDDASRHATDAQRLWGPGGEPAKLLADIAGRIEEREKLRREFDELVGQRRLIAARSRLVRLESESAGEPFRDRRTCAELRSGLEADLGRLEAKLAEARACESASRSREAVLAYSAALDISADSPDAMDGLRRHRPEPSPGLRADCRGAEVVLEWSASPAVGSLTYVVVARESRHAMTPEDGRVVCHSSALGARDPSAPAGVPHFYSLFVERGGAWSAPATAGPVLRVLEVRDLVIEVSDRQVHGKWQLPVFRTRVRVFRKAKTAPAGPGDGTEVASSGAHGFLDRDVDNDVIYYYRICVEYQDAAGHAVLSPGIVTGARPTAPPPAVNGLRVEPLGGSLRIMWDPPARGDVVVFRAAATPEVESGRPIPTARAATIGTPLPAAGLGAALDAQPESGLRFYVPVTIVGDVAVVGPWRRFLAIPDVSDLRGDDFGAYLQIQWHWPEDSPLAMVVWRRDRPPTDVDDPDARRRKVSRGEYDQQGGVRIENPPAESHHIVVYAARHMDGETVYAPGIAKGAQLLLRDVPKVSVTYALKRSWNGNVSVTFSAASAVDSLPEVVIVASPGSVQPRRIEDGRIVATFDRLALGPRSDAARALPRGLRKPAYLRAFFRDPQSYSRFQLIDPSPSQLQVR